MLKRKKRSLGVEGHNTMFRPKKRMDNDYLGGNDEILS